MTTTTAPCERSVVISTLPGDARECVIDAMKHHSAGKTLEWDTNRPDDSLVTLTAALGESARVLVLVERPYEKNIRAIVSRARKKGYVPYVLEHEWEHCAERIVMPFSFAPMPIDRRSDMGPFDLIGDVHGCALELADLLHALGHMNHGWDETAPHRYVRAHPEGRKTILLGDLVDRGPMNLEVMKMARALEDLGGLRVLGNHDAKIGKWLIGRDVRVGPHQEPTMVEFDGMTPKEKADWGEWLLAAEGHYILDEGRLVVAHAGLDEENQGRMTGGAMSFALYGKPSSCGGVDEDGYPLANDWAEEYLGDATVVHGHIVHDAPREMNNVIAIDTGCVFGGDLTALAWPEHRYTRVPARQEWWKRK